MRRRVGLPPATECATSEQRPKCATPNDNNSGMPKTTARQWKHLACACYAFFMFIYVSNSIRGRDNELLHMARQAMIDSLCFNLEAASSKVKTYHAIHNFIAKHIHEKIYGESASQVSQMTVVGGVRVSQIRSNSYTCRDLPKFASSALCFEPTVIIGLTENTSSFGGANGTEFHFKRSTTVR
jgi:hypothetical protein